MISYSQTALESILKEIYDLFLNLIESDGKVTDLRVEMDCY